MYDLGSGHLDDVRAVGVYLMSYHDATPVDKARAYKTMTYCCVHKPDCDICDVNSCLAELITAP